MVALSDWLDEVLEQASGATTEVATRALEQAGQEFFKESLSWLKWLGPFDVSPSTVVDVASGAPTGALVAQIIRAKFKQADGKYASIYPISADPVPEASAVDYPSWYIQDSPHELRVYPDVRSTHTAALETYCALYPQDTSTALPDFAYTQWRMAILAGALFRLYLRVDVSYSQPELGRVKYNEFRSGIAQARDLARRKFSMADEQVSFPPGWNSPGIYTGYGW